MTGIKHLICQQCGCVQLICLWLTCLRATLEQLLVLFVCHLCLCVCMYVCLYICGLNYALYASACLLYGVMQLSHFEQQAICCMDLLACFVVYIESYEFVVGENSE